MSRKREAKPEAKVTDGGTIPVDSVLPDGLVEAGGSLVDDWAIYTGLVAPEEVSEEMDLSHKYKLGEFYGSVTHHPVMEMTFSNEVSKSPFSCKRKAGQDEGFRLRVSYGYEITDGNGQTLTNLEVVEEETSKAALALLLKQLQALAGKQAGEHLKAAGWL